MPPSSFMDGNGQVFTETVAPVRSMVTKSKWPDKTKGMRRNPSSFRNAEPGAASLYDMSMRKCLWNIDMLDAEGLESASWHYAERIYRGLKQNDSLPFDSWCLFKSVFPKHVDQCFKDRIYSSDSRFPIKLPAIQRRLINLSFNHVSFLCFHQLDFKSEDFMALLNIPSVAVLIFEEVHFLNPDYGNLFRKWGRVCSEKSAFKKLRTLVLDKSSGTSFSLEGISRFPALKLLGVDYEKITDQVNAEWEFLDPDSSCGSTLISTYATNKVNTHERMKGLFDLVAFGPDHVYDEEDLSLIECMDESVISIYYGSVTERRKCNSLEWLYRNRTSVWSPSYDMKRPGEEPCERPAHKKAKTLRQGKIKDVGSLLGAFG